MIPELEPLTLKTLETPKKISGGSSRAISTKNLSSNNENIDIKHIFNGPAGPVKTITVPNSKRKYSGRNKAVYTEVSMGKASNDS